jgi:DNA helicase-2/ATP-dependent DNA helicase PcrA
VSSFARHGQKPQLVSAENRRQLLKYLARDARQFKAQGYESVAIICKTQAEAAWCYSALKGALELTLIGPGTSALTKGVTAMPVYLAKGLEFDAVLVCDANAANYSTEFERRLLYVACSRALHQLKVYYTGQPSPFLPVTAR